MSAAVITVRSNIVIRDFPYALGKECGGLICQHQHVVQSDAAHRRGVISGEYPLAPAGTDYRILIIYRALVPDINTRAVILIPVGMRVVVEFFSVRRPPVVREPALLYQQVARRAFSYGVVPDVRDHNALYGKVPDKTAAKAYACPLRRNIPQRIALGVFGETAVIDLYIAQHAIIHVDP